MDSETERMRETLRERKKLRMARNGATQTDLGSNELVLTSENEPPAARSEKAASSCLPFLCGKNEASNFVLLESRLYCVEQSDFKVQYNELCVIERDVVSKSA